MDKAARIAELNDRFRRTLSGGRVLLSAGVSALHQTDRNAVLDKVRAFDAFDAGDDPYREHDFVAVEHGGQRYFGKIDYYAPDLQHGIDDPADEQQTVRVLTIMRADEH